MLLGDYVAVVQVACHYRLGWKRASWRFGDLVLIGYDDDRVLVLVLLSLPLAELKVDVWVC